MIVDVDATTHDIGGDEHIDFALFEAQHHLVALRLIQIRMHGRTVEAFAFEDDVQFLDTLFGRDKHDDAFGRLLGKDMLENGRLVAISANIKALVNLLCGFRHRNFHFHRVVHHLLGHLCDFGRHRRREEDGLTLLGEFFDNRLDIVKKSHVKHAVGLVQNEVSGAREVEIAQLEVGNQASWGGYNNIRPLGKGFAFLFKTNAVVAAIDRDSIGVSVVSKTLERLVDLLSKFTRRCHNEAVHRIFCVRFVL